MTLFDQDTLPSGPLGPLVRVKLLVAYDGTGFSGFAPNPGVKTVGGVLRTSLERILRHQVPLVCAGRTDAGVHGWGQVVTFDTSSDGLELPRLVRSLNLMCAPSIVVRAAELVDPSFDARRSARARCYRYTVLNRPVADPFLARTAWHVPDPLDLSLLRLGCDGLIGVHDFSSFCRKPKSAADAEAPSMTRDVHDARWLDLGDGILRFDIEASSFCQQMVRAIVGTLVDMGLGKRTPGEMTSIIEARVRSAASGVAPPHGLVLWEVTY
ncbi:MAG: tRNA pseudouridine38-40 synthase [Actinomycetota bacterium]|nr:tRNA pseudouridine38-40 synthase [Actinomycetota bacterium]